eukprot:gb/GFBE01067853.1/.p1 GENE.gb/GFBE01067853.1/~~gb/GFBE01067853.1/.p1  ORF type:complete len:454 (+),score=95.57 gb/GFBE01067853.1/:1-1362(+)
MAVRYFPDVTVGFPQGGAARPGKHDWGSASTSWVIWTTGELRLEPASLALFFTPANRIGGMQAKPLGCLLTAAPMPPSVPGDSLSFVVTTNDPVHAVMRLGFSRPADEDTFAALAKTAEAAGAGSFYGRRSSVRMSMAPVPADASDELTMHIRERHPDKWLALVFGGCELYGPEPGGDPSSEVLLGRGAVALLDPRDTGRVGSFELVYYDESTPEPMFRTAIGPRTRLTPQPQEERSRLSMASRRLSARPVGAGMAFDFSGNGTDILAFSFDDETTADAFARDLTVRIKLAALSQKTWRGKQAMADLQGELQAMQSRGLFAMLLRWVVKAVLAITFLLCLHGGSLYMAEPEKPIDDLVQRALADGMSVAAAAAAFASNAGATICQMTGRSISTGDLERCTSMLDAAAAKECVATLVASSTASAAGLGNLGNLGNFSSVGAMSLGGLSGFSTPF